MRIISHTTYMVVGMLDDDIRARKRRSATRFLFLFVAALPFVFFLYAMIAFASRGSSWMLAFIMILYTCVFTVGLLVVFGRERILERALRASPVPPPYQVKLRDCCEEISLASGFHPPRLRYIDRDGINAFAVGWRENGTIFLTRGLLDSLNHDEILAVIAHEMARINLGFSYATTLRTTLGAVPIMLNATLGSLLGLLLSGLGLLLLILVFFALLPHYLMNISGSKTGLAIYFLLLIPIAVLVYVTMEVGGIGYFNKFFLADSQAVKWTMHPEALISAMHKMQPLYTEKAYDFLQPLAFVPYIPDGSRPRHNPDTPIIITGMRETNMPPIEALHSTRPALPSVEVREKKLEESMGHPL
jgi:hypothetical protein